MRVIGWVQRFLCNTKVSKEQRRQSDLSLNELIDAKLRLLKYVQKCDFQKEVLLLQGDQPVYKSSSILKLTPMIGEDGLLRVQGRLQFSGLPYQIQHPIIIPNGHLGLLLAQHVHVSMKHAGVNIMLVEIWNQYWMVGARRSRKRVKRESIACQRLDAPAVTQTMAPLPEMRVKQAPPFSVTGLDHGDHCIFVISLGRNSVHLCSDQSCTPRAGWVTVLWVNGKGITQIYISARHAIGLNVWQC